MSGFYARMGWYPAEGNLMVGCFLAGLVIIAGLAWVATKLL